MCIICVIYVLCLSCFCVCSSRLFVVTCWERADLLALVVMFNCVFVTFPCGILGYVWYLIVSIPDLCNLSYFAAQVGITSCLASRLLSSAFTENDMIDLSADCVS